MIMCVYIYIYDFKKKIYAKFPKKKKLSLGIKIKETYISETHGTKLTLIKFQFETRGKFSLKMYINSNDTSETHNPHT